MHCHATLGMSGSRRGQVCAALAHTHGDVPHNRRIMGGEVECRWGLILLLGDVSSGAWVL